MVTVASRLVTIAIRVVTIPSRVVTVASSVITIAYRVVTCSSTAVFLLMWLCSSFGWILALLAMSFSYCVCASFFSHSEVLISCPLVSLPALRCSVISVVSPCSFTQLLRYLAILVEPWVFLLFFVFLLLDRDNLSKDGIGGEKTKLPKRRI